MFAFDALGADLPANVQEGDVRAEYGGRIIDELARRLVEHLGRGFSTTNLRYFRTFYLAYADRDLDIRHLTGGESTTRSKTGRPRAGRRIRHMAGGELPGRASSTTRAAPRDGFSPVLGWSHYRVLMKVEHADARRFYEIEAERAGARTRGCT